MKRVFAIIAILFTAILTAKGQTAELLIGKEKRIFFEHTAVAANSVTFGYLEATYNSGAMVKLFREQKFWKAPIYIHAEYQTTFQKNHTAILGGAYTFNLKKGFITLCPLYRLDTQNAISSVQASMIYLYNIWRLEFYGYNHFWQNSSANFFGEERLHFKITDHFKIGAIVDLMYFGQFSAVPFFGIRYDF